jgi:hypothetical protein
MKIRHMIIAYNQSSKQKSTVSCRRHPLEKDIDTIFILYYV